MPQISVLAPPCSAIEIQQEARKAESGLCQDDLARLMQEGLVTSHPNIVSGAFVFTGTRVPIYNLWDYLEAGDSLDDFLESFPTVPCSLATRAIELAAGRSQKGLRHS